MTALPNPNRHEIMRYTALMSQDGTDTPQARVLENTLQDVAGAPVTITWTRADVGIYHSNDMFAWANNSNMAVIPGGISSNDTYSANVLMKQGATLAGFYTIFNNDGQIKIICVDAAGAPMDISTPLTSTGYIVVTFAVYRDKYDPELT